jgi:F-type H+-transporting ATPase subunit b
MLIDWFTVGAQALNFIILVWLMKRFLYKPVVHAIDEREKRIARELADANAKQVAARKERAELKHKNEEFDGQRAALLSKATEEAKAERQRLLDEARRAADASRVKQEEALRTDAQNLSQAISRRTQQEVFAIARKVLTDLATTSLEERMGAVFTRRLSELDGPAKARLGDSLRTASDPGVVRSAFDLPAEERATLQNALNETFSAEIHVRFEVSPDLVSGIELTSNGEKVGWSISEYLKLLEKGVAELLDEREKAGAPKPPETVSAPRAKVAPSSSTKAEAAPAKAGPARAGKAEPAPGAEAAVTPEVDPVSAVEVAAHPAAKAQPVPPAKNDPPPLTKVEPAPPIQAGAVAPPAEAEAKPEASVR